MASKITRRIAAESGLPQLFPVLAGGLSPSDLQSLLLDVFQTRAAEVKEASLLSRAAAAPLVAPSEAGARLLNEFDSAAYAEAAPFEALELSPVCPFAASSVLGGVSQNNVLTTIRGVEVLGDPTTALALECARRGKQPPSRGLAGVVRLCASQRVIRLQPFDFPGFTPHFRLFCLVSAGRDTGALRFESAELIEHIGFYLRLCRTLDARGLSLAEPLVELTGLRLTEALLAQAGITRDDVRAAVRAHQPGGSEKLLQERGVSLPADLRHPEGPLGRLNESVFAPLREQFPEAAFRFNLARLEGLGYYNSFALRISPRAPDGARYPIIDGGFTDWTARLLSDRKQRLLISGIGSEFVCRMYRKKAAV